MDNTNDHVPASARLAAIVESSDDAIISKDLNGIITSWNRGAQELFGYTADEVIGKPVTILMPPERVDEEPGILERIRRGEKIDHYETVRVSKSGRRLDISLTVSPIYDESGRIIGGSKIVRDISTRKSNEAELAKLAAIVESSNDAIVSKDLNGIIQSWNAGAENIFGYKAEEVIGKPVTILMPSERIDEEPGILERIRRGERVDHYETVRRRKDGTLLDIALTVSPVYDAHGNVVGASKIARNVTEHNRIQRMTREAETARRLLRAQEAERARIARDLHDHLGQQMTGFRMRLESVAKKCVGIDGLCEEIAELQIAAHRMDRDIGFLSWELRPTELDTLGLRDALGSFVSEWSRQYDTPAHFHSDINNRLDLPEGYDINLYRILQESLNNVKKHARAGEVSVLLQYRDHELILIVEDNGIGFDQQADSATPSSQGGIGMTSMTERATLLGGSVEIESRPGAGTAILVRVPVPQVDPGERA